MLPDGWRDRLIAVNNANTRGATGWCLEVHDLLVSKLAAGRDKDLEFVCEAIAQELAQEAILVARLDSTPMDTAERDRIKTRARAYFRVARR